MIDHQSAEILYKEIATPELRLAIYSTFTYLHPLQIDTELTIRNLNAHHIRSIFIFGKRDKMYPPKIGEKLFSKLKQAEVIIIDSNHDMVDKNFAANLSQLLG